MSSGTELGSKIRLGRYDKGVHLKHTLNTSPFAVHHSLHYRLHIQTESL